MQVMPFIWEIINVHHYGFVLQQAIAAFAHSTDESTGASNHHCPCHAPNYLAAGNSDL